MKNEHTLHEYHASKILDDLGDMFQEHVMDNSGEKKAVIERVVKPTCEFLQLLLGHEQEVKDERELPGHEMN